MHRLLRIILLTGFMGFIPPLSAMFGEDDEGDRQASPHTVHADDDGTLDPTMPHLTAETPFEEWSRILQEQQDEITALRAERDAEAEETRRCIATIREEAEERARSMGAELQRMGHMLQEKEEGHEILQRGQAALKEALHQDIERLFDENLQEQERMREAQRASHSGAFIDPLAHTSLGSRRSGFDLWVPDDAPSLAAEYVQLKKSVVSAFVSAAKANKINAQIEAVFVGLIEGEPAVLQGYEHDLKEMMRPVPVARPVATRPGGPPAKPTIPVRFQRGNAPRR